MKSILYVVAVMIPLVLTPFVTGQSAAVPTPQRIFDGVKEAVSGPADVLVRGNKIIKNLGHPD
jgi:hypothetical protein